jgi:hypothetical protein
MRSRSWFEAWRFAAEAQQVMAMRMMCFWQCDASAGAEATRMVTEKMAAAAEAQKASKRANFALFFSEQWEYLHLSIAYR